MATGFSSSLFGLITSLALGLIGRFQNLASSSLKLGFEAWLSSVVHITDDVDGGGTVASNNNNNGNGVHMQHLRLMYNVAKYSLTSSNRTNRILDQLTAAVSGLTEEQSKQGATTLQLSGHLEKSARYQGAMSYHLGRTAKALSSQEEQSRLASGQTNELIDTMTSKVADLSGQQAAQSAATSALTERMDENTQYQSVMTHHLGRTADALASHDEVALKLREIDETLNGRIDQLNGAISRSSGNIESLTEEIIRLGESEESALEQEYQRMMGAIDTTIESQHAEQQAEAVAQQSVAVNAHAGIQRPAAAPASANQVRGKADATDPVSQMRDKLAGAYGQRKDENK